MIKPKALRKGSKVAVVAPCSAEKRERTLKAEQAVRNFGLEPVMYPSCYAKGGYLSGSDKERADDLQRAFEDDSIDGIIALRGGYGAIRLLERLDFEKIRRHPKVFLGYSDVTALHIALNQLCDMVTFHGVMAAAWAREDSFTMENLRRSICSADWNKFADHAGAPNETGVLDFGEAAGTARMASGAGAENQAELLENPAGEVIRCIVPGVAEGILAGGNLSMIAATLSSPYEINTKGKILLIEEVGEALYRVDRMLMSLAIAGKFRDCAGIILGTWRHCQEKEEESGRTLSQVIDEIIAPYQKPLINNFRAGHVSPQITVPLGVAARLDAGQGKVRLLEAGCI